MCCFIPHRWGLGTQPRECAGPQRYGPPGDVIEPYGLQGSFLTFGGVTGIEPAHGFTYPRGGWGLFCQLNYTPLPRRIAADEEAGRHLP